MFKCLIDNTEFDTEKALHSYIARTKKVKVAAYYRQYFPRRDLFTREFIAYKNKEQYFESLFNARENMLKYFRAHPEDAAHLKECISLRAKSKNMTVAPCTVETRTSILPSPIFFKRHGLDYNKTCTELGLTRRFNYDLQSLQYHSEPLTILRDTREQKPIDFGQETIEAKLEFGDYMCREPYRNMHIERKSLVDLCGTMSGGFDRFKREILRSRELDSYLVVCVENPIEQLLNVQQNPSTRHVQSTPEFLCHRIREILHEFDNVQFLFLKKREELSNIIEKLFRLDNNVSTLDLQFYYDSQILKV